MKATHHCTLLSLLLCATAAVAQTYKCGNAYSQVPCSGQPQAPISKDGAPKLPAASDKPALKGAALCRDEAPKMANLMDPYSARVERVGDAQPAVIQIGQQPIEAKRFDVYINSKNRFGAYTGAVPYACIVSIDERRVLNVVSPPSR
jgi:hypothetical protein